MLLSRIIQCTIVGIMMGSVYALIAFGFNMISGVVKITNFSHGMFVLIGAYLAMTFSRALGIDPYVALLLTLPCAFIIGVACHKLFVQPILNAPKINQFILTLGLMIFLENMLLIIFGGDFKGLTTWYTSESIMFGFVSVNYALLFAFLATILTMLGLLYILYHTRLGKAMRAVADDKEAASLLSTNVRSIYTLSFGLAAVVAGVAGTAIISYLIVTPNEGRGIVIKAFIVTIFGGVGSIGGTILGGLILGLLENLGILIINPALASALSLSVMILVILFRPTGLLGKQ
jgi:branched-chain amino acid transport system permease protein